MNKITSIKQTTKLRIHQLEVQSFITSIDHQQKLTIRGGEINKTELSQGLDSIRDPDCSPPTVVEGLVHVDFVDGTLATNMLSGT